MNYEVPICTQNIDLKCSENAIILNVWMIAVASNTLCWLLGISENN